MRAVKDRDTKPEMLVRRLLYRLGYRYRLHSKNLPGKPDIVLGPRRKVIFVHGCFWHGHSCKRGSRLPKNNATYWKTKIESNERRHAVQIEDLADLGWTALVLWECELAKENDLAQRLSAFLAEPNSK